MPTWQTEPCPTWCEWQPHTEDQHPDDRYHAGVTLRRSLPLEKPAKLDDEVYEPEYLAAYLWQHVRETAPTVVICKGESNEGFRLTLDDAEAIAALLQGLVDLARGA